MARARFLLVASVAFLLADMLVADQFDDWRWAASLYGFAAILMILVVRAIAQS